MHSPRDPFTHIALDSPKAPNWTIRILAAGTLAAIITFAPVTLDTQQVSNPTHSIHPPILTDPPDANAQMQMRMAQQAKQSYEAANVERKKQLEDDSARLVALATELKSEVDKTNKDTLSLNVIRKATEVEKLAHDIRLKMRLVVGQG